jgi:uncharacterized membrane protein YphA (DoxX/SURF4 family)
MPDLDAVQTVLRIFLGSVLIVAAIAKARNRAGFARTLLDWGVRPAAAAQPTALGVIATELTLGVALIVGLAIPLSALATFALLGVFTLAASWQVFAKRQASCNCFGFLHDLGADVLLRNFGLMIFALEVCVIPSRASGVMETAVLRVWPVATGLGIALVVIASLKIARIEQRAASWRGQ